MKSWQKVNLYVQIFHSLSKRYNGFQIFMQAVMHRNGVIFERISDTGLGFLKFQLNSWSKFRFGNSPLDWKWRGSVCEWNFKAMTLLPYRLAGLYRSLNPGRMHDCVTILTFWLMMYMIYVNSVSAYLFLLTTTTRKHDKSVHSERVGSNVVPQLRKMPFGKM